MFGGGRARSRQMSDADIRASMVAFSAIGTVMLFGSFQNWRKHPDSLGWTVWNLGLGLFVAITAALAIARNWRSLKKLRSP